MREKCSQVGQSKLSAVGAPEISYAAMPVRWVLNTVGTVRGDGHMGNMSLALGNLADTAGESLCGYHGWHVGPEVLL